MAPNLVAYNLHGSLSSKFDVGVFCLRNTNHNKRFKLFKCLGWGDFPGILNSDVIHSMGFKPDLLLAVLKLLRLYKGTAITTIHSDIDLDLIDLYGKHFGRLYFYIWKFSFRFFTTVIYLNNFQRQRLDLSYPTKSCVLPNLYLVNTSVPIMVKPRGNKILYCGTLRKIKGVDIAVEAMNYLPGYSLDIAGDGPLVEQILVASKASKYKNVRLLGFVETNASFFKKYDFLVVPSRSEGYGFVILEALAAGLNIICSDIGSLKELFADSSVQFFHNESSIDLAEKIKNFTPVSKYVIFPNRLPFTHEINVNMHMAAYSIYNK